MATKEQWLPNIWKEKEQEDSKEIAGNFEGVMTFMLISFIMMIDSGSYTYVNIL